MRIPRPTRRQIKLTLAFAASLVAVVPVTRVVLASDLAGLLGDPVGPVGAELVNVPRGPGVTALDFGSLAGRSGQLRVAFMSRDEVDHVPGLVARLGPEVRETGTRVVPHTDGESDFAFVTMKPWRDKLGTYINTYHVGWWPSERKMMAENYGNPVGFIEVTPENADLRLSTHFTLRSFITRDQSRTWPKYVVLKEELLDKLELVLGVLESQGIATRNVVVLSGFRTPQYNARVSFEGAAYASRHQFGDAADLIIDANRDGRMDDLNRDGVVDFMDTDVINRAVEKVERQHPDLVGGLGLYHAMGPSGPFAHIDVRGTRARWVNDGSRRPARAQTASTGRVTPTGTCKAPPEFAHLCRSKKGN